MDDVFTCSICLDKGDNEKNCCDICEGCQNKWYLESFSSNLVGECISCKKLFYPCEEIVKQKIKNITEKSDVEMIEVEGLEIKKCPGCFTLVEKSEGCPDMFCLKCKTTFDWKTGSMKKVETHINIDSSIFEVDEFFDMNFPHKTLKDFLEWILCSLIIPEDILKSLIFFSEKYYLIKIRCFSRSLISCIFVLLFICVNDFESSIEKNNFCESAFKIIEMNLKMMKKEPIFCRERIDFDFTFFDGGWRDIKNELNDFLIEFDDFLGL